MSSSSSSAPLYVRIKRQNQTFFIQYTLEDKAIHLKNQVALALKGRSSEQVTANQMRLLQTTTDNNNTVVMIEDDVSLEELELNKDSELYVVFQISDKDEWEAVDIVSTESEVMADA